MKRIIQLAVVGVLVGGAVWGYFYTQSRGAVSKYRTARAERGPLTAAVSATGNLNAVITVQVGSQVSGNVKELLVDFNSVVKKGQVIARIDPEIFQAQVNQAKAELAAAQAAMANQQAMVEKTRADVANARAALASARAQTAKAQVAVVDGRRNVGRQRELRGRDLVAQADLDAAQVQLESAQAQYDANVAQEQAQTAAISSAEAQLKVAEAQLENARATVAQKAAALRQAEINLEHTVIVAPVDGVVVSRTVDVGQTVAASLQAPTLFTIARDLTQMQVETSVDEADIGKVQVNGPATFTVDAFPGETFHGRITQIRKAAVVNQNVVTYTVIVAVNNPDGKLLPGMTANVKLVVAEKPNVLKIPNAALRFRPPGVEDTLGAAPAAGAARSGPPSMDAMRERLVKTLNLTDAQQAKLDSILQDARAQFGTLQGQSDADRRSKGQKIREAMRARIREVLTPEQQALYDESTGGDGRTGQGRSGTPGRIWVVDRDGKPKALSVTLGISDGTSTEVLRGDVTEGQDVIVGLAGASSASGGARPTSGPRLRL